MFDEISHSFTTEFSPAGEFIRTSCAYCACESGTPKAAKKCQNLAQVQYDTVPKPAIFILLEQQNDLKMIWKGTAIAIACPNNNLMLTAGHCVLNEDGTPTNKNYFCIQQASYSEDDDGTVDLFSGTAIPLKIICAKDTPDFAILQRVSGSFDSTISLCPPSRLPWVINQDCACFVYVLFSNISYDGTISCHLKHQLIQSFSSHHIELPLNFLSGCPGGGALVIHNRLVGLFTNSYPKGKLTLANIAKHNAAVGPVTTVSGSDVIAEHAGESEEAIDSNGIEVQTTDSKIQRRSTCTLALIPSAVHLRMSASGELIAPGYAECEK